MSDPDRLTRRAYLAVLARLPHRAQPVLRGAATVERHLKRGVRVGARRSRRLIVRSAWSVRALLGPLERSIAQRNLLLARLLPPLVRVSGRGEARLVDARSLPAADVVRHTAAMAAAGHRLVVLVDDDDLQALRRAGLHYEYLSRTAPPAVVAARLRELQIVYGIRRIVPLAATEPAPHR